jgi:hypothetical protein
MTENTQNSIDETRRRQSSAVSGGIFLIALGVLALTGWWWPGIMFAIGLSGGASLIFRGHLWRGIGTIAFFSAIPFAIWIIEKTDIPWAIVGPLTLIGLGVIIMGRVLFFRDE